MFMKISDLLEASRVIRGNDFDQDEFTTVEKKPRWFGLLGNKKIITTHKSTWSSDEKNIILNSDITDRFNKILQRFPIDVDYFIVNFPASGHYHIDTLPKGLSQFIRKTRRRSAVTIVLGGLEVELLDTDGKSIINVHGKLTPWSFMHRLAHEIINAQPKRVQDFVWHHYLTNVWPQLTMIIEKYYGFDLSKAPTTFVSTTDRQPPKVANFYNAFFTFSSARNNNIAVVDELMTETITQRYVTGSIKLQIPDEFHGHKFNGDRKEVQVILDKITKDTIRAIDKAARSLKGSTIILI